MPRFVVQTHNANRAGLHHDLRLEVNGILVSWCIPNFISPKVRRLMIQTPNHSLTWLKFEGVIEDGYGKGTVSIFDAGKYSVISQNKNIFKIKFKGKKLKGIWNITYISDNKYLIHKEN